MKKLISILSIFLVLFSFSVTAETLNDYPSMFKKGSNLNVITIVGDKAPATHVLAQTQIALALSSEVNKQVPGLTRLSSEVDRINDINVISIGNACDNPTSAEILGNPSPCYDGLTPGKATLELIENANGRFHLVLNGYGDAGIRKLGFVLENYEDFPLSGDVFTITVDGEEERDFSDSETEETVEVAPVEEEEPEEEKVEEQEEVVEEAPEEEERLPVPTSDASDSIELGDSEPEPVLKDEDNFVLRIINWFKGLFS